MIQLEGSVWRTLIALFAATYALQACALLRGGVESPEFPIWIGSSMFLPAIFALIHLKRSGEGWKSIGWRIGKPLYLILSLTVPALLTLIAIALFEVSGLGKQPALWVNEEGQLSTELGLLLTAESMNRAHFAASVLATGVVVSLVTGLLTIGEEIGWRGFFQRKLLERNGRLKSILFLGLVWAFWHLPLILAGFNYPRTPVLGAFVFFPLAAVGVSCWIGWMTLRAKSVWPAVFFHAGINGIGTLMFELDFGENDLLGQTLLSTGLLVTGLSVLRFGAKQSRT